MRAALAPLGQRFTAAPISSIQERGRHEAPTGSSHSFSSRCWPSRHSRPRPAQRRATAPGAGSGCRRRPIAPEDATSVWTGSQLLVFGRDQRTALDAHGNPYSIGSANVAAAYDPAARRWRRLAPPKGPTYSPGPLAPGRGRKCSSGGRSTTGPTTRAEPLAAAAARADRARVRRLDRPRDDRLGRRLLRRRLLRRLRVQPATEPLAEAAALAARREPAPDRRVDGPRADRARRRREPGRPGSRGRRSSRAPPPTTPRRTAGAGSRRFPRRSPAQSRRGTGASCSSSAGAPRFAYDPCGEPLAPVASPAQADPARTVWTAEARPRRRPHAARPLVRAGGRAARLRPAGRPLVGASRGAAARALAADRGVDGPPLVVWGHVPTATWGHVPDGRAPSSRRPRGRGGVRLATGAV